MNRAEILDTAKEYVTKDRAATHGDAEQNFTLISLYWSAHLDVPITAADVGVMMTLFKLARIKSNPAHLDSYIDGCGYLACAGEIAVGKPITFGPPQPIKRGEAL
jgi:hypothetical protein